MQFVLGALKWAQNLAGLKLVFNKLGVLWQPHWLCALYWIFTAKFTPPHTLQYEISCWHIPCWSPAYQHQTQHILDYAVFSSRDVKHYIANMLTLAFSSSTTTVNFCFSLLKALITHFSSLLFFFNTTLPVSSSPAFAGVYSEDMRSMIFAKTSSQGRSSVVVYWFPLLTQHWTQHFLS